MLYHLGLAMAYRRASGPYIPDLLWYASMTSVLLASWVGSLSLHRALLAMFLCSTLDHRAGTDCRTSRIYVDRQDHKARRAMGVAERQLEHHRHLDDLLPYSADASSHARGALPRDVQDVYKYRRDAHRVCRSPFHHRNRSRRHIRPESATRLCVWPRLDQLLC